MNDKIFLEIYSYQNCPILLVRGQFTLSQLKSNSSMNQLTEINLYNFNHENKGCAKIQYYVKNKTSYIDKLSKKKIQINLEI